MLVQSRSISLKEPIDKIRNFVSSVIIRSESVPRWSRSLSSGLLDLTKVYGNLSESVGGNTPSWRTCREVDLVVTGKRVKRKSSYTKGVVRGRLRR